MLRTNNVDLSPRNLLQNVASPQGPLPPGENTRGSDELNRLAGTGLIAATLNQINTARVNGIGGKVDILG